MDELSGKAARREAVLQRVQQVLLAVVEDLADAVAATADEDEKARLACALHHVSRSLRQTVYLEAKLERGEIEAKEAAARRAADAALPRISRRKTQVSDRIERRVWDEYDADDDEGSALGDELIARADEWLEAAAEDDSFLDEPLEALVTRLCAFIGLPCEASGAPPPALPNSS